MHTTKVVHELDQTTLRPFVDAHDVVLLAVLMMLPQFEQPQPLVPVLQSIAESSNAERVGFAYINANGNWDAVKDFEIRTYPHVMLFRGYEDQKVYRGPFVENSITSYLDRFLHFPEITQVNAATLYDFKGSSEVVIGYTVFGDTGIAATFEALAKSLHPEVIFGMTDDADLARAEDIDVPAMVVYNNRSNETCTLAMIEDVEAMKAIIRKAALPLIVDLYPETHEGLLDLGTPFAYVFTKTADEDLRISIADLARKYRGKIQFSIAPASHVPSIVEDLHLNDATLHAFAIREPNSNLRYPMPAVAPDDVSASFVTAIESFTDSYIAGGSQPTIKSEPIPPPTSSACIKVVGLTYDSIVNDPNRDVLLTICIEKCGPCHILYPVLEEVAELYRAEEENGSNGDEEGKTHGTGRKTTIATVLYDENDIGIRGVRAFPTILMFPANSKSKPVRFFGERKVERVRGFVEEHRSLQG